MDRDVREALESIDPEWLLNREGIPYKTSFGHSGRQLNIKTCPACGESKWRVYMNAETGLGSCFSGGCPQPTFNRWVFIRNLFDLRGHDLARLIKELAIEQGWRPRVKAPTLTLQDLNTLELPDSVPAWEASPYPEYLARRGVFADMAEYFQLHYSKSGQWVYMDPRGMEGRQDYSNRILIPIFDLDHSMVSFQGRDTTGEHEKRYLFPPGFASAGAYLYNAFNVTTDTKGVVISEGVFDVIKAQIALQGDGATHDRLAVGTFGMHLSGGNPSGDDQVGRLRKLKDVHGVRDVTFLWDGERKAARAAIVACLRLAPAGFNCKVALIPDGKDPGSAYAHEIREAVLSALPCNSKLDAVRLKRVVEHRYTTA